jgi:hypothetical protein
VRAPAVVAVLAAAGLALAQAPRRIPPVDEAQRDLGFAAFRARLMRAAAERDLPHLLEVTDARLRPSSPWVSSLFPDDYDPNDFQVVLGPAVRLRASPGFTGQVVASLDYDIVEILEAAAPDAGAAAGQWALVQTAAGQQGWVARAQLRSAAGMRACFAHRDGAWKMVSFIGGN